MQFRKRLLASRIRLVISASGLAAALTHPLAVQAQQPGSGEQWTCRADSNGQWQCAGGPAPVIQVPVAVSGRGAVSGSTGSTRQGRTPTAANDWVPRSQMTTVQQQALPLNCCGAFIEPERNDEFAAADPATAPTNIEAADNISQPEPGVTVIQGPTRIEQGYRSLQSSNTARIDRDQETISLDGEVIFREPGKLFTGNSAFLDQATDSNTLEQASYVLHQTGVHGSANRIIYDSAGGVITIDNGEFSRCEPGNEFWVLRARELELDTEAGVGYATSVSLRIKDVPVFYYPFTLPFPISDQRVSGFLPPSISSSDEGLDVAVPYYFNIAPQADATLTPRFIADRGAMASAEFRYLADWSMNTLNTSLMPKDDLYDPATAGAIGSDTPPREKRWFAGFEHEGRLGNSWTTRIDYNKVSDENYFRDLGSSGLNLESRTHLLQMGAVDYRNTNWQAGTRVQRIQVIDPFAAAIDINKPYDRLPELRLGYVNQADNGLQYGVNLMHVSFDRELDADMLSQTQINNGALVTGERLSTEAGISWPMRTPGVFVVPTLKYRFNEWSLQDQALVTEDNPDIGVGTFSLDTGLIFDRSLSLGGSQYTQTLEPRLFYLYTEQEDQSFLPTFDTSQLNFSFSQLFRDNRFSGADRIGDANQLSAALTTRLLDDQGRERGHLSLGQIFHFEDRIVSLDSPLQNWQILQPLDTDRSALIGDFAWQFNPALQLRTNLQWNEDRQRLDEGNFSIHYQRDQDHIINLAFRYREIVDVFLNAPPQIDPRIKQTDFSAVWPLNENWRFLGRWNYDHSNSRNLESFAGVEYSNCCTTIRLIGREWVSDVNYLVQQEPRRGIFLQISLNGLGDLSGGGVSSLLSEGIAGFKEYEPNE